VPDRIHTPVLDINRTAMPERVEAHTLSDIGATLLTGGFDKPYVHGLATALASKAIALDVIGSDAVDHPDLHTEPKLNFLKLQRNYGSRFGVAAKALSVLAFYVRLLRYATVAKTRIFHILWNNKLQYFDRTLLLLFYRALGKKIVFTAHNVNAGKRDGNDSWLNRLTLRIQYRLCDHIFVHTERMKKELVADFGVLERTVTVIPFGINESIVDSSLTPEQAKRRLGIDQDDKTILFYGAIRPYKGLKYLLDAFHLLLRTCPNYKLIIAGEPKKGTTEYMQDIRNMLDLIPGDRVIQKLEHVPDEDTELYFKAADVCVLPYTLVFQSGVLFLSYRFGLPVIASDVGSFREDIVEGRTGSVCRSCDSSDLAKAVESYFAGDLYRELNSKRQDIRDYADARYSWTAVGETTRNIYAELLQG
jgi:glycosyltransferase involved in cell wall biosynthesis